MEKSTDIKNRQELENYFRILTAQGKQINFASIAKLAGVSRQGAQHKYNYLKSDFPVLCRKRGMLKTDLTLYLESLDTSDLTVSEIEVLADKFCEAHKIKRKGGVSAIYGVLIRNKKTYKKSDYFHVSEATAILRNMDTSHFTVRQLWNLVQGKGISHITSLRRTLDDNNLPYKRVWPRGEK